MSSATYDYYKVLAFAYFNNKCSECGGNKGLRIHHEDEDSLNNDIKNLSLLCSRCHGLKHHLGGYKPRKNKKGIKVICSKCKYSWKYTGKNPTASCPSCGLKTNTYVRNNSKKFVQSEDLK